MDAFKQDLDVQIHQVERDGAGDVLHAVGILKAALTKSTEPVSSKLELMEDDLYS